MVSDSEAIGETIPETCPACGRDPIAVVHDVGKAAAVYDSRGTHCVVDGPDIETAYLRDRLYYIHEREATT